MKNNISQDKLLQILNLSRFSIAQWKKDGCPSNRTGKRSFFKIEQLRDWLIKHGKIDYAAKLDSYFPQEKKELVTSQSLPNRDNSFELKEGMDIFTAKQVVGSLLLEAAKRLKNAKDTEISIETNNISKLTNQLRQLEESCIEIDKLLRKVIPIEEVKMFLNRSYNKVKTNLLALPYSVADQLASMTNAENIAVFLRIKIEEKLTALISDIEK